MVTGIVGGRMESDHKQGGGVVRVQDREIAIPEGATVGQDPAAGIVRTVRIEQSYV